MKLKFSVFCYERPFQRSSNISIIIAETTRRLLSVTLAYLSIFTLRLFKAVFWKALRALLFFSMDDLFSSEDDDHLFDLDYNPYARKRPLSSRLDRDDYDETDDEEANRQKLYLVPYRCVFNFVFYLFCLVAGRTRDTM